MPMIHADSAPREACWFQQGSRFALERAQCSGSYQCVALIAQDSLAQRLHFQRTVEEFSFVGIRAARAQFFSEDFRPRHQVLFLPVAGASWAGALLQLAQASGAQVAGLADVLHERSDRPQTEQAI